MMTRGRLAILLCALVMIPGCVSHASEQSEPAPRVPSPLEGDWAGYHLTFRGESFPDARVELRANGTRITRDATGATREAIIFGLILADEVAGHAYPVAADRGDGTLLHHDDLAEIKWGVQAFAENTSNWGGHPVPGVDVGRDLRRCIFVGLLAAPLRLAAAPDAVRVSISGIDYAVETNSTALRLVPEHNEALQIEVEPGSTFFPQRAVLRENDGGPFCELVMKRSEKGTTPLGLGKPAEVLSSPPPKRIGRMSHLPPTDGLPAEFPLPHADQMARSAAETSTYFEAHPDAYLVYAEYQPRGTDESGSEPSDVWMLRYADASRDSIMIAASRLPTAAGIPIESVHIFSTERLPYVAPRDALRSDVATLGWALERASEWAAIHHPTRINWFTAERPDFMGTPDESLWQIMDTRNGTRSLLVSASDAQAVAIGRIPQSLAHPG